MPIRLAVPYEITSNERRIALAPDVAKKLNAMGVNISMQKGAALSSQFNVEDFEGVNIVDEAVTLYKDADVIFKVQPPTLEEVKQMNDGAIVVSFMAPHNNVEMMQAMNAKKITSLAMELIPRITRAQSMDALSSQASIAGYMGVLMAAQLASVFSQC